MAEGVVGDRIIRGPSCNAFCLWGIPGAYTKRGSTSASSARSSAGWQPASSAVCTARTARARPSSTSGPRHPIHPGPSTGSQPLLINPTEEDPLDHLAFSPTTGRYAVRPGSAKGDPSLEVFGINRSTLILGRQDAWTSLERLLVDYAQARAAGRDTKAEKIGAAVRRHPFAGVLAALLRIASGPDADLLVEADCLEAIRDRPEISNWG